MTKQKSNLRIVILIGIIGLLFISLTLFCNKLIPQQHSMTLSNDGIIEWNGNTCILKLKENPTTGYQWHVTGYPVNKTEFVTSPSGMIGSGGTKIIYFTATQSGTLDCIYIRQWDINNPAQHLVLSVNADNNHIISITELSA